MAAVNFPRQPYPLVSRTVQNASRPCREKLTRYNFDSRPMETSRRAYCPDVLRLHENLSLGSSCHGTSPFPCSPIQCLTYHTAGTRTPPVSPFSITRRFRHLSFGFSLAPNRTILPLLYTRASYLSRRNGGRRRSNVPRGAHEVGRACHGMEPAV
jgi:hypothetical protein